MSIKRIISSTCYGITPYTERLFRQALKEKFNAYRLRADFYLKDGKIYIKGIAYTKNGKIPFHLTGKHVGYGKVIFKEVKK